MARTNYQVTEMSYSLNVDAIADQVIAENGFQGLESWIVRDIKASPRAMTKLADRLATWAAHNIDEDHPLGDTWSHICLMRSGFKVGRIVQKG